MCDFGRFLCSQELPCGGFRFLFGFVPIPESSSDSLPFEFDLGKLQRFLLPKSYGLWRTAWRLSFPHEFMDKFLLKLCKLLMFVARAVCNAIYYTVKFILVGVEKRQTARMWKQCRECGKFSPASV